MNPLNTIALEFVPPKAAQGPERVVEEAAKVNEHANAAGLAGRIGHLMIPGIIEEDPDRPVEMEPKMDPLDVWNAAAPHMPHTRGLCTQVTAFMDQGELSTRISSLTQAGIEGVIFVGVPRGMADGDGGGVPPTDALDLYRAQVEHRGVILIPTRDAEHGRFNFKCDQGATFGMTQLLYSDAIVAFLKNFAQTTDHRPEILLSFGFVPKMESKVELIQWLIQDPGNPAVEAEQRFVTELATLEPDQRRAKLVELYKRVIDGVQDLGFPVSIHLEAPYGFVKPAFETFAEMLEYWAPDTATNV